MSEPLDANESASLKPALNPTTRVHYLILALLSAAMAGAYMCRGMAAITTTLQAELHKTEDELKPVVAGFALGYLWMQIPGGWLGSRFGSRIVLPLMSLGWSLCTLAFAFSDSVQEMTAPRLGIGLFQGGLIPCVAKVVADWIPPHKRGMASAFVTSSMQIGALLGLTLTPLLMSAFHSWRPAYVLYGALGIAWSIAFALLFRNRPAEHPWVNAEELAYLRPSLISTATPNSGSPSPAPGPGVKWRDTVSLLVILFTSSLVLMNIQAFFRAFGYEFFQSWFPAYLEKARGLPKFNSSLFTTLPIISIGVGGLVGGGIVDGIYRRTKSRWLSRSVVSAVTLLVCGACTLAAVWVRSPTGAILLITVGTFFFGFTGPTTWAALIDISGRHTGVVSGLANMCGNLGAAACAWSLGPLFTYIGSKQSSAISLGPPPSGLAQFFANIGLAKDWNVVLYLFVAVYTAGAVAWLLLNSNIAVDSEPSSS